ncbi:MAG: DUF6703 family protein [Mycobacteriales bacterium]
MPRPEPVPPATGLRRTVERRSGPVLVLLSQQPKLAVPVISIVLLIAGLALPRLLGAAFLLLLLLLVGWLSYLSWPVVVGPARVVRLLSVALIAVLLVTRLF